MPFVVTPIYLLSKKVCKTSAPSAPVLELSEKQLVSMWSRWKLSAPICSFKTELFCDFGYNRYSFVNKGSLRGYEKSVLCIRDLSNFLILLWFAYQSHCLRCLLPKGRKNSRGWATSLFIWLIVRNGSTQKIWHEQIFGWFYINPLLFEKRKLILHSKRARAN